MPSFSFVGDEPLSVPCSVMMNTKTKQEASIQTGNVTDSAHTLMRASSIADVQPSDHSSHVSISQEKFALRLYHRKPGPLGVTIKNGTQCTVIEKKNQNSLLEVDDVIISLNGRRYDSMLKSEGGTTAWVNLCKTLGVKSFVVLRQGSMVAPLKDVSNTKMQINKVTKMAGATGRACFSNKAITRGISKDELLTQVKRQWRTGKSCHQTSLCKAAIRRCLLNDISPNDIAFYVISGMEGEVQAMEVKRVQGCANYVNKSLKIQAAGIAAPAMKTKKTDVEDLVSVGIPFQRKGFVYKKGDKLKKRKTAEAEGTNEKLDTSIVKRIHTAETTDRSDNALGTALITPSSSADDTMDSTGSEEQLVSSGSSMEQIKKQHALTQADAVCNAHALEEHYIR